MNVQSLYNVIGNNDQIKNDYLLIGWQVEMQRTRPRNSFQLKGKWQSALALQKDLHGNPRVLGLNRDQQYSLTAKEDFII